MRPANGDGEGSTSDDGERHTGDTKGVVNSEICYNDDDNINNNDGKEPQLIRQQGTNTNQNSTTAIDIRSTIGTAFTSVSELINNNLIVARYGIVASIGVLTIYGLSQTPLFFRYRYISEIPATYFTKRKSIYCRVIGTTTATVTRNGQQLNSHNNIVLDDSIILLVRHLSPIERLLPKSTLDWITKYHPSKSIQLLQPVSKEYDKELMKIQLPGICLPPKLASDIGGYSNSNQAATINDPEQWIGRWTKENHIVKCVLLARKISIPNIGDNMSEIRKAQFMTTTNSKSDDMASTVDQTAIAHVMFQRKPMNLFSTVDFGEYLIRYGRAVVKKAETGLFIQLPTERIMDTSDNVKDLRRDVSYLERLHRAEFDACKGYYGIWSNERMRQFRKDLVDEVEFQQKANVFAKLWRWIRGG